ncbi:MAG: hypothetical protein ACYCX3_07160 [Thermoleophilia bacterium]
MATGDDVVMVTPRARLSGLDRVLVGLEILLAVGAIPAGLMMVVDPSGDMLRAPLSMLDGSPFADFLWPGVILLAANGVLPLAVVWAALRRRAWAPLGHVGVCAVLCGWILVEIAMLGFAWLQAAYLGLGVVIIALGVWRWRGGLQQGA